MNKAKPTSLHEAEIEGLRVLVVENDYLNAMLLAEMLSTLSCAVVGPCANVSSALTLIDAGKFDVALVDFHLQNEKATLVAERLVALERPFAIVSGGGDEIEGHGEATCLRKPFMVRDVREAVCALAGRLD